MRIAAWFLLAATACAQTYEIRGTVTEPGVGGVPGMVLRLLRREGPVDAQVTTDARGGFRFVLDKPGAYLLEGVGTQGAYFPANMESSNGYIILSEASPRAERNLAVVRTGQITGLVLDEQTRQPVADHTVTAVFKDRPSQTLTAVSNQEGRFSVTRAPPGDYVIGTRGPPKAEANIDAPDSEPEAPNVGYAEAFWPGGAGDLKGALPVRLSSGGIVDVGTILLHKTPLYKIHLSIPQGECPEGESVRLTLHRAGADDAIRPRDEIRCGSDVTLHGLDPGSLLLHAVSDWQGDRDEPEKAVWGSVPVSIADKNMEATIRLTRGVLIEGHFIVPAGQAMPGNQRVVTSRPAEPVSGVRPPSSEFFHWTSDTAFVATVQAGPQILGISDRYGSLFVREIRYNGAPVKNRVLPIAGTGEHKVEIVLDEKGAEIAGNVIRGAGSAKPVTVFLFAPQATSVRDAFASRAQDNGEFRVSAVPGDYRIFASEASFGELGDPGVLERVLAAAEKITITPGMTERISLRLIDVGR